MRDALIAEAMAAVRENQEMVQRFDEAAAAAMGINLTDGRVLDQLDRRGPTSPSDLARAAGLTTGAMTTLLDRLERLGYARRTPHPKDRRRIVVELTAPAKQSITAIYGPLATDSAGIFNRCTDAQLRFLRDVLRSGSDVLRTHLERLTRG